MEEGNLYLNSLYLMSELSQIINLHAPMLVIMHNSDLVWPLKLCYHSLVIIGHLRDLILLPGIVLEADDLLQRQA